MTPSHIGEATSPNIERIVITTYLVPRGTSHYDLMELLIRWYVDVLGIEPKTAGHLKWWKGQPQALINMPVAQIDEIEGIGPHRAQGIYDAIQKWIANWTPESVIKPFPVWE